MQWRHPLTAPSSCTAGSNGATLIPNILYVTLSPIRKGFQDLLSMQSVMKFHNVMLAIG